MVVLPVLVEVDKVPDGPDRGEHYDGGSDQLLPNDAALVLFVELGRIFVDHFARNISFPPVFQLHLDLLVNPEIQHGRVDQIQRAGGDEDTEETVEPDRSVVIFLKAREGSFLPLNALHSL